MYNSKRHTDVVTGIYCFTNKVNGKQYVGLSKDIAERYASHIGARSPKKSAMFLPIRKYGIESFTFEVLEECSEADLCEREIYWIEKLDSYNTGYNKTTGGEGASGYKHSNKAKTAASHMKEVIVTKPDGTILIFESAQAAAEALGINQATLSKWAGGRRSQPGQGKLVKGAAKLFVGWTFQYKS
jgi:predicted GIY-YIG superfamily endonuclease